MEPSEKMRLRKRWVIIAYGVLFLLALVLIGISQALNSFWRPVVINIATELIGAGLLFFAIRYLFLLDDWEQIENLLLSLQRHLAPSAKRFFLDKIPSPSEFRSHIRESKHIDMCGVTLANTLVRIRSDLAESLRNNAKVRILILEPSPEAIRFAALRSGQDDPEPYILYYKNKLTQTGQLLHRLISAHGSRLQVRFLPFPPSFGMLRFKKRDQDIIFVEVYPQGTGLDKPPYFTLKHKRDPEWFQYFLQQFEHMWSIALPWETVGGFIQFDLE